HRPSGGGDPVPLRRGGGAGRGPRGRHADLRPGARRWRAGRASAGGQLRGHRPAGLLNDGRGNPAAGMALPLSTTTRRGVAMDFLGGLFSLIILALDIWAIIHVVRSGASVGAKVLWILLIVILPLLGLIIWAVAGPRAARL